MENELTITELEMLIECLGDFQPTLAPSIKENASDLLFKSLASDDEPEVFAKKLLELSKRNESDYIFQKENAAILRSKLIQIRRDLKAANLLKTIIK